MGAACTHLSSATIYFSTEFKRYFPLKPPNTNTLPLQSVIACAFLDSLIGYFVIISFLANIYILASFLGGEPPPVIKISSGERAIAAEHW